ncbi:MAG: glycosyltransferase family 4 protein [Bacteroidota bacterium]|uniref:Glycosyltransferase family 4 protein n=1 Tax=Flagellimonas profundi TaxID=2915620 RepID=A0ABS3FH99_9FLAO|nr:glycosyltransferase family 4 protein [Allomuricauda profundi]MBO0342100.1 glycosyltransferase family 4 protein [Allomuricauda profundi]MEC7770007.1 glycosyltransferase family 4 protein [Bacteroidota bacterium]
MKDFKVVVVLPNNGPLKEELEQYGVKVITSPVIKVSRSMFTPKNLLLLPLTIFTAIKTLEKELDGLKVDIVHSNTLAVLLGAFYAKKNRIRHIWHVHEIIKKPKVIYKAFPVLLNLFSEVVVYNSRETMKFWNANRPGLAQKSHVILNGLDRSMPPSTKEEVERIRKTLFGFGKDEIVVGLIGRINHWKGQELMLEAFNLLKKTFDNLKLVFVGSAYEGKEYLVTQLQNKIEEYRLNDDCKIIPFQKDIWPIWDSLDIAVVASTEPEPFGLVAVEAMLSKKPVVAAGHGGLLEIVDNGRTGYFFEPNSIQDLTAKLADLIADKERTLSFGENGFKKASVDFSSKKYVEKFTELYTS